jgi:hypothetical protein
MTLMELPVELNKGRQKASAIFAERHDFGFASEWRKTLGGDTNPLRVDAVDFADLAVSRFQAHSEIQPYAGCIEDIGDHIGHNPMCEVASFVLLTCDWFPASKVIGICHFRRTWSNRIILDYLAAHPFIVRPPSNYSHVVRGVGTALLYVLSTVAKRYESDAIWGEATQGSCAFYKNAFKLDAVQDLIYAPIDNVSAFISRIETNWAEKTGAVVTKETGLAEIYASEEEHPPFVGSKTAMFNPARKLAYRFLDLPYHTQVGIAEGLGLLQEEDMIQPAPEQFRRFFRRASDSGKLPELWREVERHHPDGEPDKNPFPRP